MIAMALALRPEVLIADEPTTALDVTVQGQILYQMQTLVRESGAALIWITHDLALIAGLADRIAVMFDGRIMGERLPSETDERALGLLMAGVE
jgi:peptide/nickel transport system ATP-binding protein